jgi:hypothetical protein
MPLKDRQYKRLGRIARNNPDRAERVGERMIDRSLDMERGKDLAASLAGKKLKDEERKARELKEVKDRIKQVPQSGDRNNKSLKERIFGVKMESSNASVGRDYPLSTSPTPKSYS